MASKKVIVKDITVNKDVSLVVRLTPHLNNELNRVSKEWGSSKSDIIRVVLMNFFSEMDDDRTKSVAERIDFYRPSES